MTKPIKSPLRKKNGSPTLAPIKDYRLQTIIGLWLMNIFILLYVIKKQPSEP
jgi:hypothetical protein